MPDPLSTILANLRRWSGLPKYALERRLDIFLTPYLEEFLAGRLGYAAPESPRPPRPVRLVVPEFPLRHRAEDHLTVNVDYLLLAENPRAWIFLELKTDGTSVSDDQCEIYLRVRGSREAPPMRKIVRDLVEIAAHTKNGRLAEKYSRVLRALHRAILARDCEHLTDRELADEVIAAAGHLPIEVVYLSPEKPDADVTFVPLRDLARWRPAAPDALWPALSTLLLDLADDAPLVGSRVPWMDGEHGGEAQVSSLERADGAWTGASVEWRAGSCVSATRLVPRGDFEQARRSWTRALRRRSRSALAQSLPHAAAGE